MTTKALLIGTPATVRQLERQLALLPNPPVVAGCLLHQANGERYARGCPVLGDLELLEAACAAETPALAIVSLPAAMHELIAGVRTRLRRVGVPDRFIATLEDQIAGVGPRSRIDIDLPALVGRPPRGLDLGAIDRLVRDRTVLVTGAGGSIGGELCRLLAGLGPDRLVLVDRSENALFEIDRQIARRWPALRRRAALHDVVEADATRELFAAVRPDIVFHAAAHKHVPMSEEHPGAAIDNNLFGTVSAADAAIAAGAERFVMVSTDKAVRPTSVMGMTKRLAELYVQHVHRAGRGGARGRTGCSMVRFGNVLGSSGSVLETWARQIADGGPLTVTDPRMTRYFMSIPEAAGLVLQAAALHDPEAPSGEVFVLDMGEPIPIVELAKRYIAAHGLEPTLPGEQPGGPGAMPIVFTGARPGEKLHEELALDVEAIRPTRHPDIRIWGLAAPEQGRIAAMLATLRRGSRPKDADSLIDLLVGLVPESQRDTGLAAAA